MHIRLLVASLWLVIPHDSLGCDAMAELFVEPSPATAFQFQSVPFADGYGANRVVPRADSPNRLERLAHERESKDGVILAYGPDFVQKHGFSAGFRVFGSKDTGVHRVQYITSRFATTGVPSITDFHENGHVFWDRLARQGKVTPMHANLERNTGGTSKLYGQRVKLEELSTMAVSEEGHRRALDKQLDGQPGMRTFNVSRNESMLESYREALRICDDTRKTVAGIRSKLGRGLKIRVTPAEESLKLSNVSIENGDETLSFLVPAFDASTDRSQVTRTIRDRLDAMDKITNEMETHFKILLNKNESLMARGIASRAELKEITSLQRKAFEASLQFLPESEREEFSRMVFFEE